MKRYERQITLPEIGLMGQLKLAEARVLIVGVGGLGCPVLQNLAAVGVGKIGIIDRDIVEESNLHRQHLYSLSDCGKTKVAVAAEAIARQNPDTHVVQYADCFSIDNANQIASYYDIIVDCSDNIETRYLINDVAVVKGIPMVYASIHKFEGQLSVFNYQDGPTYRCLFPEKERAGAIPSCNDSGVLGVMPNILGALQANEVLKIILGIGEILNGKLILYNGLNNAFQTIEFQKYKF
ncbi:HesA/MoeB/ThiF family protein [Flavobacterium sp.]